MMVYTGFGMGLSGFDNLIRVTVASLLLLPLAGCDPLVNIEGAFFPAWLISGVSGIVCMVVTWSLLRRLRIDEHLLLRALSYICMFIFYTTLTWLLFYAK